MQIFHVVSLVVPLIIALGLPRYFGTPAARSISNRLYLYGACVLFFISWYLPSPLIDGEDTSFVTHFVGGGIFSALLWEYIKQVKKIKLPLVYDLAAVFALVSTLGATNELFEFALVQLDVASILLTDTSWDIVANTSGASVGCVILQLVNLNTSRRTLQDRDLAQ